MMLEPGAWSLAHEIDRVLPALEPELGAHVTAETHKSALELRSRPHKNVAGVAAELEDLRGALEAQLETLGLRAAASGTHPFAVWQEVRVSTGPRYQRVYDSMRELARREPTFALHVHVGVADPDAAIDLLNRMRGHLPLLLALSANSPLWQGRDTGLASARTPLFQAFPRVGIPRAFRDYDDWAETVDVLLRCEAFEEPTFLWWDVRPQPRFGTVEVRILDAQSTLAETVGLTALVQCIARLELEEGYLAARRCSPDPSCSRRTASSPRATAWTRACSTRSARPWCRRGSSWTCCSRRARRTPTRSAAWTSSCRCAPLRRAPAQPASSSSRAATTACRAWWPRSPTSSPRMPWPALRASQCPVRGWRQRPPRPRRTPAPARARAWLPSAVPRRERRGVWPAPGTRR